jgi:YggT family protein
MSNFQTNSEVAVDRREETQVTQQPGYVTTEQTVRDVAAERRMQVHQLTRIIGGLLAILQIMLGLRFALKLMGANAASGFGSFVYGATEIFVAPFAGLFSFWSAGDMVLEVTTLVAMAVYALVFWAGLRTLSVLTERTGARSVTRSTHEQTAGGPGNERTTHTTTNG